MLEVMLWLTACVGFLLIGAGGMALWIEHRHECLPHSPRDCAESHDGLHRLDD